MNAKQQYKLAYRMVRLYFVEQAEISEETYPYWFDCPDRHRCGDYCQCLEDDIRRNETLDFARKERNRIAPMVRGEIKAIASKHYLVDRYLKVPNCGIVQSEVNRGFYWTMRAYPSIYEGGGWRWQIDRKWAWEEMPVTPKEEKLKLRERVIEEINKRYKGDKNHER